MQLLAFFSLSDNLHLLDCTVTWSKLTRNDKDWTCWLAADAQVQKHKHRFKHDSDRDSTVHQSCTAYKLYKTGRCCCAYQWQTKHSHSSQLMLGRGRRRNTWTESFKKQANGNTMNTVKMTLRTLFAENWKLSTTVQVFSRLFCRMPWAHTQDSTTHSSDDVFQTGNAWLELFAALPTPLQGENSDIVQDYCSLHFKYTCCWAPQQRQGQICIPIVWGENICQEGSSNFAHAISWGFVVQCSRY